ncbi:MAG: bifunctional 2-C-methyl-D-erythritol 4-phosphate cytidylyltransferase/2-C-methyl-D-erythritol 2,4-cyclodiphosphate synthase [Pseudomonadota bacterium]
MSQKTANQGVAALIVAAGRGNRARIKPTASATADNQDAKTAHVTPPKQYEALAGRPVLAWSLSAFAAHPQIDRVTVIIHPDDETLYAQALKFVSKKLNADQLTKITAPVSGGDDRQASVYAGLSAINTPTSEPDSDGDHQQDNARPTMVLIHDAARPLLSEAVISRVLSSATLGFGAIAALPVVDTLKRTTDATTIEATVDRAHLWRAQTPQAFPFERLLSAHTTAAADRTQRFTDDAALADWAGLPAKIVFGEERNMKITNPEDLALAAHHIGFEQRVGTGFDVHRFAPGDGVWLCGIKIPHEAKLAGHSDADVGLHALTDALLGAIGDGDIGAHFPPTDAQWKDAASDQFLADARRRVAARGGRINNVDVVLMCEAPKIGPHRDAMRQRVSEILDIEIGRVGVKATTTEQLGFTGRREGIAAMASATVTLPLGSA